MTRRPVLEAADERGITLVELVVTLAIASVVIGMIATAVMAVERQLSNNSVRQSDLGESRVVMDALSKSLRAAAYPEPGQPAFTVAEADEVVFHANLDVAFDGKPKLVSYVAADGELVEEIRVADPEEEDLVYPAEPDHARVLTRILEDDALFTFFCDDPDPDEPCDDVSDAEGRLRIELVGVEVAVSSGRAGYDRATVLRNTVRPAAAHYVDPMEEEES